MARYSSNEIAKLWARGEPRRAANHSGTFRYDGDVLYSYAVPIARKMPDGSVQITTKKYSVTTSGHVTRAHRAIPAGTPIVEVEDM